MRCFWAGVSGLLFTCGGGELGGGGGSRCRGGCVRLRRVGYGLEDGGAVEEGGSGGVEVDVFHATENLGHEGVEGEAATPVGADDFVVGEVLDEGPELVGGGLALAGVVVSDGFGAMDQDYESEGVGDVHEGGHFAGIGDVEVLGVGM